MIGLRTKDKAAHKWGCSRYSRDFFGAEIWEEGFMRGPGMVTPLVGGAIAELFGGGLGYTDTAR